ncbi:hypothetical protein BB561_001266 [Smittium simulii]|uniref:beta-glucosidase n=1 Tax=Smittium simulii TaxID=133385 RepID=A0A2T9YVC1_9FUNG|nr:hypothetical protein BB561_001266 [Smittium simulii]
MRYLGLYHFAILYLQGASIHCVKCSNPSFSKRLRVKNFTPPNIPAIGIKKIGDVTCLPDRYLIQDYDPIKLNPKPQYTISDYNKSDYVGPNAKIDQDVIDMVQKMSLEEKAGQMAQIHAGMFLGCDGLLNITQIEYLIDTLKIGSFLDHTANQGGRWNINSPQRFANLTNTIQQIAINKGAKIPIIWGIDSVHGANYIKGATLFPQPTNIAATFNVSHAYHASRITAKDTRAAGIHWAFAPLADINQNKLWSRNFENFGEDPYLAGEMVYNSVKGYQGNYKKDRTRVAACVKHFIAYSNPYNGKDQEPRYVSENVLFEYILPPFQKAIEAGVATTMEAYGALNNQDIVSSKALLRKLLRDTLNFKGVLVTDWDEIESKVFKHHSAFNLEDAIVQTLGNGSVDISMTPSNPKFPEYITKLVRNNEIPVARIDESVGRILQLKKDLGLFDNPFSDPGLIDTVGSLQDKELAAQVARDSIILLKNERGALPLQTNENVLFIGPNVNSIRYLCGAWTMHWQGPSDLEGDDIYDGYGTTILQGIESITKKSINWIQGYDINGVKAHDYDDVLRAAQKADKVVFFFGEKPSTEIAGNINTLNINPDQQNLVDLVSKYTKAQIVLVLVQNRPLLLEKSSKYADAIVNAMLPCAHGGLAIAEMLYGKYSPSARLPYTYPKYDYQSSVAYYRPIWNEYEPEFAFGAGFGYNDIKYSEIRMNDTRLKPGKPVEVSITATNNGKLSQLEPVIMFAMQAVRREYSPERYKVRAFDKKLIEPGSSVEYKFILTTDQFKFWTVELNHVLFEGPIEVIINAGNPNQVNKWIYMDEN